MTKADSEQANTCFVITPIGEDSSEIRREIDGIIDEVIIPVLKENGIEERVAHRMNTSGLITSEVIRAIYNSTFCIANLTESNPNVMYELSFAHAVKKKVIHIVRKGSKVPFDISQYRFISYVNDICGTKELREKLREFVEEALSSDDEVINPITEALKTWSVVQPNKKQISESEAIVKILDKLEKQERMYFTTANRLRDLEHHYSQISENEGPIKIERRFQDEFIKFRSSYEDENRTNSAKKLSFGSGEPEIVANSVLKNTKNNGK